MNTPKHDSKLLPLIPEDYFVEIEDLAFWSGVSRWSVAQAVARYERQGLVIIKRRGPPIPLRIKKQLASKIKTPTN